MEAEHRGEHAGDVEDVHDVGEGRAVAGLGEQEEQVGPFLLGRADDLRGPGGDGERPGADDEEEGDEADGEEHDAGDEDVGPAGLLGVDGGLFEADEGGDAEAQGGAEARAAERRGVEGVQRHALPARPGEAGDVEGDDHRALDEEQHAEHLGVEVDLQPAEHGDDDDGAEGRHPPGEGGVEVAGGEVGDLVAEDAEDADLEGAVGDEGHQGGGGAGGAAEAAGDVGVERAGVVDVAAHLGVAEAEQREDDAEDDEQQRLPDHAHDTEGGGHDPGHHHQRRAGREYRQEQARHAQPVGAEPSALPFERADLVRRARSHHGVVLP